MTHDRLAERIPRLPGWFWFMLGAFTAWLLDVILYHMFHSPPGTGVVIG